MLTNATVADLLRPCEKRLAGFYDAVLIAGGSLLIALSAQVSIGWPVPFTGQTFAVLMIGALLGARRGSLAVLAYLIEGAAGLPVFSRGGGGLPVLLGPTGGYLAGFVSAAFVTGSLAQEGREQAGARSRLWLFVFHTSHHFSQLSNKPHFAGPLTSLPRRGMPARGG